MMLLEKGTLAYSAQPAAKTPGISGGHRSRVPTLLGVN